MQSGNDPWIGQRAVKEFGWQKGRVGVLKPGQHTAYILVFDDGTQMPVNKIEIALLSHIC